MIDINLIPKNGEWSEERIKTYFLQRIAISLETIVRQSESGERTYELLKKEREEHETTNAALWLMLYKDEIRSMFEGKEYMRFSDFRSVLISIKIKYIDWLTREELSDAIRKTDYIDLEKTGTGFRVKLISN